MNGPLAPALPDVDKNGWHKDEVWEIDAPSSFGDWAVGTAYEARYWKRSEARGEDDGDLFMVIDESYYVETPGTDKAGVDTFLTQAQYRFTICTDPERPGSTEEWSGIEYDQEVDIYFHENLTTAETSARNLALADQRWSFTWDGQILA